MTTFLSLCNSVERESGTVSRARRMSDVSAPPTDRQEKIVKWVADAWLRLQRKRQDWVFMAGDVSASLASGKARYSASELGVQRFGSWVTDRTCYRPWTLIDPALGPGSESEIREISYDTYRQRYERGVPQLQRPVEYAVSRDFALCFGSVPDKNYLLRGEYRKLPQALTANDDVPDLPEQYHDAIMWRAVMTLAEHDQDPVQIATARANYAEPYGEMCARLTAPVTLAAAGGYFG